MVNMLKLDGAKAPHRLELLSEIYNTSFQNGEIYRGFFVANSARRNATSKKKLTNFV